MASNPPALKNRTMQDLGAKPGSVPEWAMMLTPRKLAFLTEYLVDFNGRQAAKRAKLSSTDSGCSSVASGLLREPDVMAALAVAMADHVEARRLMRERIIQELSCLAFYDVGDHITVVGNTVLLEDTDALTDDQRRAVKRYKQQTGKVESIEVEFHDKVRALDLLDRVNGGGHKGGGDFNVQVNNTNNDKVLVLTEDEARATGLRPVKLLPNPQED